MPTSSISAPHVDAANRSGSYQRQVAAAALPAAGRFESWKQNCGITGMRE